MEIGQVMAIDRPYDFFLTSSAFYPGGRHKLHPAAAIY